MARFATGDLTSIWTWTLAVWGERCSCSSSEACRGDANNRTKSPQFGVFERGWGGGDGGTETGARTRTGKDGDLGERGDSASAECRLINGAQGLAGHSGSGHWGEGGGPKAETGSARDWLVTEQNPPCSIRVRAGQPTAFWNVGRLQNTQHAFGAFPVVASSVPGHGQQQISSSNIPGNQLDQSGHQPRVPLRLHLWRWGRLCATMGSLGGGGGKRLHLGGQAFFFSLLFQYGVPAASSKHPGVAGAEGAESNLPGFGVRS